MAAYIILTREKVRDQQTLDAYSAKVPGSLAGHDARPRVVFGRQLVLEGPEPNGVAIIEFPTFDEALAWYNSPAYQEAAQLRFQAADFRCVIVEGLPKA